MTGTRKKANKVKAAHQRSLERALQEERLAIAAIVKVMLIEVPDPARVMARLDAMTRAAEANPRVPATVRRQLLDATRFVRTAIERETGKPQSLFDPHVGHTSPRDVDALVNPTDGPQQLGLVGHQGSMLGDVEDAHEDRVRTIAAVHTALVGLLKSEGAATDRELYARYTLANQGALPMQSQKAITERRRELVGAGRVVGAGKGLRGEPAWDVVERELLQDSA